MFYLKKQGILESVSCSKTIGVFISKLQHTGQWRGAEIECVLLTGLSLGLNST